MEINDKNPVEKDELTGDKLLSGHDYDDIRELDNNLPKWWIWLFIITIIYAVVYVFVFDVIRIAPHQEDEYNREMAAAASLTPIAQAMVFDTLIAPLTDQASLDAGKAIFDKNCVVCHKAQGQGLVGPNLTDAFSIHGCRYIDAVNVIATGVPEKGMISWKPQLTKDQILQVASYTMTLRGTNPPDPKAPQGDPCK
ncbi:MAG: c-type cytochrome [Bacteroidetes bacterium]|nr:c-type cytochrome [Bacteroidota bacterium]